MRQSFPALELRAEEATLEGLRAGPTGFCFSGGFGPTWLRGREGEVWAVNVNPRTLQFMFEVFGLAIDTPDVMQAQIDAWAPPPLPDGIPEFTRARMSTRPVAPSPPSEFEPWPFPVRRMEVLRRTEFIVEHIDVESFGSDSGFQGAAKAGEIPPDATAVCAVAVGLLFRGDDGQRLLIGVDWAPFQIVFSSQAAQIDQYLASCDAIEVGDYANGLRNV